MRVFGRRGDLGGCHCAGLENCTLDAVHGWGGGGGEGGGVLSFEVSKEGPEEHDLSSMRCGGGTLYNPLKVQHVKESSFTCSLVIN